MTYDQRRQEFNREHIYIVELDLDYCSLTFGSAPCTGGIRSIVTSAVSVNDFNVGDEIEGGTSGAIAEIESVTGTSPTLTISYRTTNGTDFQTAAETITNNTATGSATKNGNAPTLITGGDDKCFNTFESTQDASNYTKTTKTYRFCESRSPHPIGLDAIPNILSVSLAPSVIDVGGGLGVRARADIQFNDLPHGDSQFDIDKYLADRTYIASERGTFFTKLRARNPNYQFREMRVLSGYLVDGVYDSANFQTRYYVVESLNASRGTASIVGKDPLKLATRKKAQVPAPSTGQIANVGGITAGAGSLTVTTGTGSEYTTPGKIRVNNEVMSFTRVGDVLTLTRAQNNTIAAAHAEDDTVQLCYEQTAKQVYQIVEDLITNFANIDSSFVPTSAWKAEDDTYLNGLLEGIITKPMDVFKVLKELAEASPHYLWYDERVQEIQFTALKAPPVSANQLNMDENLIADSVSFTDKPDARVSTVFVNFGQYDPTKRLDEPSNYTQTYVRIDTDSIAQFVTNEVRTINSRWISSSNKAQALRLAALIGRRFAKIPRAVSFALDAKDSDTWAGQIKAINHRDVTDFTGLPLDTFYQVLSVRESDIFQYNALEFKYGDELPEDEGGGDPDTDLILLSIDEQNVNLRTRYNSLFPTPDATTKAKFVVENGVVIGSSSTGTNSIETGSWPAGALVTLQLNSGSFIVGAGGAGAGTTSGAAGAGGQAINMTYDLSLDNNGVIGGGGGGGGRDSHTEFGGTGEAAGGGGAGNSVGAAGLETSLSGSTLISLTAANAGTLENGGAGGFVEWNPLEPADASGGNGGDLGAAGVTKDTAGGAAGVAIDKNGNTLTEITTGDIRGSVVA